MSQQPLEQLRTQIDNEDIDAQHAEKIDRLKSNVQRGMEEPEYHPTLLKELEESLIEFGDSHPRLAAAIQSAINSLSSAGI